MKMLMPDEIKKAKDALKMCHDLITFNPMTGEDIDPQFLNEDNRDLYYGIENILEHIRQLEKNVFDQNMLLLQKQDIITKQERRRANYEEEIWQLKQQIPSWINVQDRLPEDDVDVIVYAIDNNGGAVTALTSYTHKMHGYNIEGWVAPWQYFFHDYKITHWMHKPVPPKEEE